MVTLPFKAHVQPDGTLNLRITTGLSESDVDGVVVIQPTAESPQPRQAWPEGFFEQTYGAFAAEPLERRPQGGLETRELLR